MELSSRLPSPAAAGLPPSCPVAWPVGRLGPLDPMKPNPPAAPADLQSRQGATCRSRLLMATTSLPQQGRSVW